MFIGLRPLAPMVRCPMERWVAIRCHALWGALLCFILAGCARVGFDKRTTTADAGRGPETSQSDDLQSDARQVDARQIDSGPLDVFLPGVDAQALPDDENRSSLRFKRLCIEGDGVRQYEGWYDVQFQLRCSLRQLADGTVRCLPRGTRAWSTNTTDERRFYTDDTCTHSLWAMSQQDSASLNCPGASMSWMHFSLSPCASGIEILLGGFHYDEILLIGAKLTTTHQNIYSRGSDGACVQASPPAVDILYDMIPVDYKTLPEFNQVRVSHGKRLDSLVWQAADGTTIYQASFDTSENNICQLKATAVGGAHCIPAVRVGHFFYHHYTDDQCTSLMVGVAPSQECEEPKYFTRMVTARCSVTASEVFTAGAPISDYYYLAWGNICTKSPITNWAYQVGAQVSLGKFAAASSQMVGTGRLRQVYLVADGATQSDHIYDTLHQVRCRFTPAADGKMRCLPISASALIYYTDATCTQTVAFLDCPDSAGTHYLKYNTDDVTGCGSVAHVHRTLGEMSPSPSKVYRVVDGDCNEYSSLPGGTAVKLSAELAPGDFVEGVECKE